MVMFLRSPLYAVLALFISYTVRAVPDTHAEDKRPNVASRSLQGLVPRNGTTRTTWKFAVVLFPKLVTLDFQYVFYHSTTLAPIAYFYIYCTGPIELLGILSKGSMVQNSTSWPFAPYEFVIDYVADTKDPIIPVQGPPILPTKTISEINDTQYDLILVPGGMGSRPQYISPTIVDFVRQQTPGLQYLLGVCTGSWILANAGVLEGKNATTNKAAFKQIKAETSTNINWIAKARWVVDGTTWTSSGVTAGMDMAYAFMTHLVGADFAIKARNTIELRAADQGDDPFADIYGLLD